MKKTLLASVALLSLSAAASAADLPSRRAPAPVVAALPVFTWTGLYVGANAGYGWSVDDTATINGATVDLGEANGFVGGGQVGFNYQIGAFVVGVEGDLQWANFGDDTSDGWFGTARARAGVAFDRALVYATGGFAFADNTNGWSVGGGVEYAFTNNLSAKVEGLYVKLDTDLPGYDADLGLVRAGLNYKFSTY
jgi:outer membrane immunogenic protein